MTRQRGGVARLLDVVEGRSAEALRCWIAQREPGRRAAVVAVLDPYRGYAAALRTGLPTAVRVLDAFQVTWLGFAGVDEVRRRIQQEPLAGALRRRRRPELERLAARSTPGAPSCWPTSTPSGSPTDPRKQSTS
jgi:transposase